MAVNALAAAGLLSAVSRCAAGGPAPRIEDEESSYRECESQIAMVGLPKQPVSVFRILTFRVRLKSNS